METREKGYLKPIFIMVIVAALAIFKVYLANETYYTSRDIQKISSKISALKEEKNIIQLKIEKLKYKNTIIDPLFTYKQPEETKIKEQEPRQQLEEIQVQTNVKKPVKKAKTYKKKNTKELFETINTEDIF